MVSLVPSAKPVALPEPVPTRETWSPPLVVELAVLVKSEGHDKPAHCLGIVWLDVVTE